MAGGIIQEQLAQEATGALERALPPSPHRSCEPIPGICAPAAHVARKLMGYRRKDERDSGGGRSAGAEAAMVLNDMEAQARGAAARLWLAAVPVDQT
jgi:hypothetical protein